MASFKIGITMAGAISAGAYSGGVLDFLIEALEQWESRKAALRSAETALEEWDVPSHDVVIPVMSGASAGAITAALGVIAAAEQPAANAVPATHQYPQVGTVTCNLPRLYQAWVQMPCFVSPTGGSDFLGLEDLKAGAVTSALDTTLLQKIVDACLAGIDQVKTPRPYFAQTMHMFFAYTNLRGVPYEIGFTGDMPQAPGYAMQSHGDRRHYTISGLGQAVFSSSWAVPDPSVPLGTAMLPTASAPTSPWQGFAVASLGSSAFPVGLTARAITGVTVRDYTDRQWPLAQARGADPNLSQFRLVPTFPPPLDGNPAARVDFVTSDGGIIDNDPFQLARWTLMDDPPTGNTRAPPQDVDRAVVTVVPFPELPDYDAAGKLDTGLISVIKRLIPVLKDQARFKPGDMADALNESIFSRFLISPRRYDANGALEPFGIACGLLGGFGGFVSEEIRAHDYQLGRLNCYRFLRNSFAINLSNTILAAGYGPGALQRNFQPDKPDPAMPEYQIIPLVGTAAVEPTAPVWPRVAVADVDTLVARAKTRINAVINALKSQQVSSRILRFAVSAAWTLGGQSAVSDYIRWAVMQDLIRRDQLTWDAANASDDERKVLAALADPAWDFRTENGIAAECSLSATFVAQVLQKFSKLTAAGPKSGMGAASYTLNQRKPGWFGQLPGIKQAGEFFSGQPAID